MNDTEFNTRYEETLAAIEDIIEDSGTDLDYETVNDILTITCPDNSSIIITPQSATGQLWLAAKAGGFHFDYDGECEQWICTADGRSLPDILSESCLQQGGVSLDFS